jgi:hypothetical protein
MAVQHNPILTSRLACLDDVMVRRLKEDLRQLIGGFPKGEPVQVDLSGLPPDTAELKLGYRPQSQSKAC